MWIFSKKYTPRWIVLLIDITISVVSIILAYLLRFNFEIPKFEYVESFNEIVMLVVGVRTVSFLVARTFSGIVRYTGLQDVQRIVITLFSGTMCFVIINLVRLWGFDKAFFIPMSIVVSEFMFTLIFMLGLRWVVKMVLVDLLVGRGKMKNVVIYGTNDAALSAKQAIESDRSEHYRVVAFVDNISKKSNKQINNVPIYPISQIEKVIEDEEIDYVLLAQAFASTEEKQRIIDYCLSKSVTLQNVPKVDKWINGELSSKQIRRIKIEDLLERDPIQLDYDRIQAQVKGKVVMVTGAAGSIGSEMVRQLIKFEPEKIVLFDQAETPMYEIETEIADANLHSNIKIVMGDITDQVRVEKTISEHRPEIIYHAAAYKHVPMMENNPIEAVRNNVFGTKLLADMAIKYGVKRFVMVSTDKAVNPTNVMGCTKRICEIYTQSLNATSETKFITTRFGNVLGSNGSVIPRFKKQIEDGGPITVTHPNITRFFMTIPEACQLVLEAGASAHGGEIFIFDMGKSVKIADLAAKMVKLSGLQLGKDIQIVYTGLRPGEKLYEELLADKENTVPTPHPQIMVAKVREYDHAVAEEQIEKFREPIAAQDHFQVVAQMKAMVPEFQSKNSIYEVLDRK